MQIYRTSWYNRNNWCFSFRNNIAPVFEKNVNVTKEKQNKTPTNVGRWESAHNNQRKREKARWFLFLSFWKIGGERETHQRAVCLFFFPIQSKNSLSALFKCLHIIIIIAIFPNVHWLNCFTNKRGRVHRRDAKSIRIGSSSVKKRMINMNSLRSMLNPDGDSEKLD